MFPPEFRNSGNFHVRPQAKESAVESDDMVGKSLRFIALFASLLGCASLDEAEVGQVSQEGRVINGRVINGRVINGRVINGRVINGSDLGAYVASVRLDRVQLAGQ